MASPGIELGRKASFLRPFLCSTNKNAPQRTKTLRIELKTPRRDCEAFLRWCHQESNRGHKAKFLRPVLCSTNTTAPLFSEASCLWCHQESNRGHKDFQSFALPTELWHQFLFASANLRVILILPKRRAVFLRFLGKRGWLAAELAAESSAVAGFPAV